MVIKNWELKSRSRFCFACERPFNVGQVYHCLLDFSREEPERKDYCERCWKEKEFNQRRRVDTEAYWRAIFKRLYTPVEDEAIKKDVIQSLLDKYINSEEPSHINLCYILGLLEERKKVFFPRKHTIDQEGNKIVIYENVQTGDTCIIRDPGLTLAEAEKVQAEVQALIENEKGKENEKLKMEN